MESPADLRLLTGGTTQNDISRDKLNSGVVSDTLNSGALQTLNSGVLSDARADWSFNVATVLQRAVCDLVDADRDGFVDVIRGTIVDLPEAFAAADCFDLSRRLLEFSLRVGNAFHERQHPDTPVKCAFVPERCSSLWLTGNADPKVRLADWLACYLSMFDAAHPAPPAQRAAKILRDMSAQPMHVGTLARMVGVSRSVLLRQFARDYGMSPAAYRTRARLIIGIAALQDPAVKVSEAARRAGYRSTTNFNAALKQYLKMTPSQARRLPHGMDRGKDCALAAPARGTANADRLERNQRCA